MSFEQALVATAVLLLLSIAASKASTRLGIPALLLFLLIGMLAGSDGPGRIPFDNYEFTQSLGIVALALILFAGGLDTDWQSVRPVLLPGLTLATVGVLLTAILVGGFAIVVLGFSPLQGVLLGAIVSSTDAAAVFAVLRSRGAALAPPIGPLIEFESGSNDPMAVFLTTSLVQLLLTPEASPLGLIPLFFRQMIIGILIGLAMGRGMAWLINKSRLEYEGLYPVLSLALVVLTYGLTAVLGGNGFLAVYLSGLILGNSNFVHHRSLMRFHDGIAWLMQIAMFLILGLLAFPSEVVPLIGPGLLISFFLMLIARPISVFVSLAPTRISWGAKALVGWVGLRGAVPIILATFPLLAGVPDAVGIFHLVFFIVLTSVLVQGTSLPLVARWLGVTSPTPTPVPVPPTFVPQIDTQSQVLEVPIAATSPAVGRSLLEINLPSGALVVLISRDGSTVVPSGASVIMPRDRLVIVATNEAVPLVYERLGQNHDQDRGDGTEPTRTTPAAASAVERGVDTATSSKT